MPWIRVRLRLLERLEAQALERRLLRVPNAALDLALPIRVADPGRQRDGAVVPKEIAEERIQDRVVDLRLDDAFAQVVEHDDLRNAAQPAESALVELGPDPRQGLEREQPDRLPAEADVMTKSRVRRYFPVSGWRTIGPSP